MASASRVPVNAEQVDPSIADFCRSGWACEVAGLVTDLWLFIAIGISIGCVLASLAYLKSAQTTLEKERSRTAAEQEAFLTFARRVADLTPSSQQARPSVTDGGVNTIASGQAPATSLTRVRDSYRDTVMAVPHYQEEYREPLMKNMTVEFGRDIAETVSNGDGLTPLLQQLLVSSAKQAAVERRSLMSPFHREAQSLDRSEEVFQDVQSSLNEYHPDALREEPFEALEDRWKELEALEARCTDVLDARQRHLQDEPWNRRLPRGDVSFCEYLYQSLDVDYPVLATGVDILDQVRTSKQTLTNIATTRT